jgi:hypothetical protein
MNRHILFIALTVGLLPSISQKAAFGDVSADEQNSDVSITITKFQVNDQTLELGWKIVNNSNHDVWICDSLSPEYPSFYEYFLDKDDKTLVLRIRSDLPMRTAIAMNYPPLRSRYVRLGSGQEKVEFVSLDVPIQPYRISEGESGNAKYAKRLVLEIGFFNEDLPGLILQIVELADKLNCDLSIGFPDSNDLRIVDRFFAGRNIAQAFNYLIGFSESVMSASGDGEFTIHYLGPVLNGEQVLHATIDGVSIPYKSNYPPLTDEPPLSETEPAGVTMALTGFDVNDTNLELSWKIKNNTDHDVWVCNGFNRGESIYYFERYMDKDNKTLVLRRRYNLSSEGIIVERYPSPFRYLRLRPGQEKVESHSFTLPVTSITLFHTPGEGGLNVESAQRLAIEIGFYDEDLRALILGVVDMVEKLGCDGSAVSNLVSSNASAMRLYYRFFGGFTIAGLHTTENISFFRNSVTSDGDEILMPTMHQSLNGEQILRLEVENLSIPFSLF